MALSHGAATRTALCNAAVDRIDLGTGTATGKLNFLTALDVTLCSITLLNEAFGPASGPSAALLGVPLTGAVSGSGVITKFRFIDRDAATIIEGSVSTSGADINLSSVSVNSGDSIQIDAITYTATT